MMKEQGGEVDSNVMEFAEFKDGGIHIKPENVGKFTAWAKRHNMSVQEAASHIMANKDKYSSTLVKRANFAKNAAGWKHEEGGEVDNDQEMVEGVADIVSKVDDLKNRKSIAKDMINQFEEEDVDFDYDQFLNDAKVYSMANGGINNPGFRALPDYVQAKILRNMEMGGQMMYANGGINNPGFKALPVEVQQKIISNMENGGQLIKRADGSYSQRGLWDNIRANKGSGKKPTKEMLEQEKKIKAQYEEGGMIDDNDDEEIIFSKGGIIPERYKNMGFSRVGQKKDSSRPGKKWMVLAKKGNQYKVVHGGYKGMEDFTQHHSEKRRDNFWNRMGGKSSSKATDPFSPLYWHKRFGTWEEGGVIDYDNYEVGREYDLDEKEIQRLQKLGYKISFK
jgi:hypothetical protein